MCLLLLFVSSLSRQGLCVALAVPETDMPASASECRDYCCLATTTALFICFSICMNALPVHMCIHPVHTCLTSKEIIELHMVVSHCVCVGN